MTLTKAEEGQNRQNHNNQADKIDKTVHGFLHMSRPFFSIDNRPQLAKFLPLAGKVVTGGAQVPSRASVVV
jgi:hypothetical protein